MSSAQIAGTIILALITISTVNSRPTACEPGLLENMLPHIRKMCVAWEYNNKVTNALSGFIDNEASARVYNANDVIGQPDKRTDADHVFLRFGRRR